MEFYFKHGMCLNRQQGYNWINNASVGMHEAYGFCILVFLCVNLTV